MKKSSLMIAMILILLTALTGCGSGNQSAGADPGYAGIDVASPEWVGALDAAKDARRSLS